MYQTSRPAHPGAAASTKPGVDDFARWLCEQPAGRKPTGGAVLAVRSSTGAHTLGWHGRSDRGAHTTAHHLRALHEDRYGADVEVLPGLGGRRPSRRTRGDRAAAGQWIQLALRRTRPDDRVAGVDLVITGEGRFDATSVVGKFVGGIIAQAQTPGAPVLAIAGSSDGTTAPGLTVVSLIDIVGRQRACENAEQAVREAFIGSLSSACHGLMPIPGESDGGA